MKIPTFKGSKIFVGDAEEPCLKATLKNSAVPGLATEHIKRSGEDPRFTVFLRGPRATKVSAWQSRFLEQLFTNEELTDAIREGMSAYEKRRIYDDEEERRDIQKHGLLAFLYLEDVVIDETKQEVLLLLSAELEDLGEHGIVIHRVKNQWRFDTSEYFSEYLRTLNPRKAEGRWAKTDPALLYGRWVLDEAATVAMLKKEKHEKDFIQNALVIWRGGFIEFSPGQFIWKDVRGEWKAEFIDCQRRNEQVQFTVRVKGAPLVMELKLEGDRLVCSAVLRREKNKRRGVTWSSDKIV